MCRDCGCETRTLQVQQNVFRENNSWAEQNRKWLDSHHVVALDFISSPGSGKTMLLERTLDRLCGRVACAVITADQQTDRDAQRLAGKGAVVRQILTGNVCHLDARRVGAVLDSVVSDGVRLLFVENVGNLVCPAAFELGEKFKVALLSVTEGEDKPLKYPTLFVNAPVVVLTKNDLLPHLEWDHNQCIENIKAVRPDARIFELSARSCQGLDPWIEFLEELVR